MSVMQTIMENAPGAVKTAADFLIGDEIRAAKTVGKAITGQNVSAGEWADLGATVGTDLLMLVPGGQMVKAGKYAAKGAKEAGKAVAASKRASRATAPLAAANVVAKHENKAIVKKVAKNIIKPDYTPRVSAAAKTTRREVIRQGVKQIGVNKRKIKKNKEKIQQVRKKFNPEFHQDLAAVNFSRARKAAGKTLKDPRILPNIAYGGVTNEW